MNYLRSIPRERRFGAERRGVLRAPHPNRSLATLSQSGEASPRTLSGTLTPRVVRPPELGRDAWAFRGSEGLAWSPGVDFSAGFTASVLVRMRSVAVAQMLLACDSPAQKAFVLYSVAGGPVRWEVYFGASSTFSQTPSAYPIDRWRWVTVTFRPGELGVWIDATYRSATSGPAFWNAPTTPLTVGWRNRVGFENRLDADVAWLGVWSRVLAHAEVRELHRSPRPPIGFASRASDPWRFPMRQAFAPIAPPHATSMPAFA